MIGYLLAGITIISWGLCVIPVKMSRAPGRQGVFFSILGGLFILTPFFLYNALNCSPEIWKSSWKTLVLYIVLGGICQFPLATIFYYEAIKSAEISTIVPLKSLKIIVVIILVFLLGIEPLSKYTILGGLVGIAGAFTLAGKSTHTHTESLRYGIIMVLLACVFWAIGDILLREAVAILPSAIVTPAALFAGGIGYYSWLLIRKKFKKVYNISKYDKICYLIHGILSFGVGYCMFFAAMNYIGINRTVIITSAWPLIAFLVGILLYREKVTFRKIAGTVLLIGSIYIATVN